MVYTEVLTRNGKKYYYRVLSVRDKDNREKVTRKKIYLGANLSVKNLILREKGADKELGLLDYLLSEKERKVLERIQREFAKEPAENYENRYEAFCSLFTYDSAAIEGNTFSLQETSLLLFDKLVPQKPLREVHEIMNHKEAFDYLLLYKEDITKSFICRLHSLVVKNTLREHLTDQVGRYRISNVFIRGVEWKPPQSKEVPGEMRSLLSWYSRNKKKLHPFILACYFHVAFETIHPFVDGNGRVGRLLMNFILRKHKYPMINIPNKRKHEYYDALHDAQIHGNVRPFITFMYGLLSESVLRF